MWAETALICTTILLVTLGVLVFSWKRGHKTPTPKIVQIAEKGAEYVSRDKFTEWKSGIESRMKAVETQWDDTYKKMRRKEARYMAENRHDEKPDGPAVAGLMEPPMTGEELEKAHNRLKLGI